MILFWSLYCLLWTHFTTFSCISIVGFKQGNIFWVPITFSNSIEKRWKEGEKNQENKVKKKWEVRSYFQNNGIFEIPDFEILMTFFWLSSLKEFLMENLIFCAVSTD